MTVKEYNGEFLPKIDKAKSLANNLDLAIEHTEIGEYGKENVRKHLRIHANWSDETKETILKALEYYRLHAGLNEIEYEENAAPQPTRLKIADSIPYYGESKKKIRKKKIQDLMRKQGYDKDFIETINDDFCEGFEIARDVIINMLEGDAE